MHLHAVYMQEHTPTRWLHWMVDIGLYPHCHSHQRGFQPLFQSWKSSRAGKIFSNTSLNIGTRNHITCLQAGVMDHSYIMCGNSVKRQYQWVMPAPSPCLGFPLLLSPEAALDASYFNTLMGDKGPTIVFPLLFEALWQSLRSQMGRELLTVKLGVNDRAPPPLPLSSPQSKHWEYQGPRKSILVLSSTCGTHGTSLRWLFFSKPSEYRRTFWKQS